MVMPCRLRDLFCDDACIASFRHQHHVSLAAAPRIFNKASAEAMFADWDGYCPVCNRHVAIVPLDVHTFDSYTLVSSEAEELGYLGFGSRVVHDGTGPSSYVVVGLYAAYAVWQCGQLQSGCRGGAERFDSLATAVHLADTL